MTQARPRSAALLVAPLGSVFVLMLAGCGGGEDEATPTATVTVTASPSVSAPSTPSADATPAPSASDSISEIDPVGAQGFPEGERYWTFKDSEASPVSFAAYSKRTGDNMCLIKMYPEYIVETGTVSGVTEGQSFAVNERPETMLNPYVAPYIATVTGDPNTTLVMNWPSGTLVLNSADQAGAAAAVTASNPGSDGFEALARITPNCG